MNGAHCHHCGKPVAREQQDFNAARPIHWQCALLAMATGPTPSPNEGKAMDDKPLEVDAERVRDFWLQQGESADSEGVPDNLTGIFVRAMYQGRWGSYDIVLLTRESLDRWLRSRGGANEWAESVVRALLGYSDE